MTRYLPFISLMMLLFLGVGTANSFVVQDGRTALSYNNYARDCTPAVSSPSSAPAASSVSIPVSPSGSDSSFSSEHRSFEDTVDNKAIAKHLLPELQNILEVDLTSLTYLNVKIPNGYTLVITLPEEERSSWHINTNENILKPLSSHKSGGLRVLEFQGASVGLTKLYLDNMLPTENTHKAVQSRILRVKVTP